MATDLIFFGGTAVTDRFQLVISLPNQHGKVPFGLAGKDKTEGTIAEEVEEWDLFLFHVPAGSQKDTWWEFLFHSQNGALQVVEDREL